MLELYNADAYQKTISKEIEITGIGLHSGKKVEVTFKPSKANTGIVFVRTDITPNVVFKTSPEMVRDTELCTSLENEKGYKISTIEHLLSALFALDIDNIIIEVNASELPIMDGSAQPFISLLNNIKNLEEPKKFIKILKRVRVEEGDKWAEFRPSKKGFSLEMQIEFNHSLIKKQTLKIDFSFKNFFNEISRARTFCFMKDVEFMHSKNLALGGSLDNAVVLDDYKVVNPEGLRYEDEFVRHKMLDAIGDLYVSNKHFIGSFIGHKTGHNLNNKLIKKLLSEKESYKIITFEEKNRKEVKNEIWNAVYGQ